MQNALLFLVKTITDLYLLAFLLRFILQWVRADYYNPLAQLVLKVTSPLVLPARRMLPSVGGVDFPTLVVLIALQAIVTWLLLSLAGASVPAGQFVYFVILRLVSLTLWFYLVAILIYAVLSWIGPRHESPIGSMLAEVVEPVLAPLRRILPPIGGLDLSPLVALLILQAVTIALPLPGVLR